MLGEYESLIKHLITNYERLSPTQSLWMVRLTDQIKGYGSVKEQNIALPVVADRGYGFATSADSGVSGISFELTEQRIMV